MKQDMHGTIKKMIGQRAASLVKEGMVVGIGSGTTATYFIESLIERCRQGLKIKAVSTSIRSAQIAREGGIPIIAEDVFAQVDLCIDGADEVAPDMTLIKGGGGNLVREKIVASSSHEMLVIIDESKLVHKLGAFGLPVEIVPFGYHATLKKINDGGFTGALRRTNDHSIFVTDNGNYIYDISFANHTCKPKEDEKFLCSTIGVVDTGFFFNLAKRVLVGYSDGRLELYNELPKSQA